MADLTSSENPIISAASSSSSSACGAADDSYEDACSICLEPFNTEDPASVTSCKHEYHLQCILEWSQRSKECPICAQSLVLKDPASQELLAAVESERNSRSRHTRPNASMFLHHFHEDSDVDHDAAYSDDSDFDDRIMQHLAAVASRARYGRRRERQRSSGFNPSQVLLFSHSANVPDTQQTHTTSPEENQNLGYELSEGDSPTSNVPSTINVRPSLPQDPSIANMVPRDAVNRDVPYKPRVLYSQPSRDSPPSASPSELFSFSESMKSRWSAASARYKESISKSTRGFKEKLLARNNSVKELSKGVQREMNAGIAGVARMLERLDLTSKRSGAFVSDSSCTVGTSNFSYKGKGVQDNMIAQSLNDNKVETAHNLSSDAHNLSSDASSFISHAIPGQMEVPHAQGRQ